MNANSPNFVQQLNSIIGNNERQADILTFATGVVAGMYTELENIDDSKFKNTITAINELSVIDTDEAMAVAKALLNVRQYAVKPKAPSEWKTSSDECISCDIFTISENFENIDTSMFQDIKAEVFEVIDLVYKTVSANVEVIDL